MSPTDNEQDLELTREQRKLFREALLAAYTDFNEIRMLVRFELDDPLNGISPAIALDPGVGAVLDWAEKQGKTRALSQAVFTDRPGNSKVRAYQRSLVPETLPPPQVEFERVSIPAQWNPAESGLEAIVQKTNRLVSAVEWREAMRTAEQRICRIDAPKGQACGTGFLVGADLVLTNCHVYREVEGRSPVARFGFGAPEASCEDVPVKGEPLAISSEELLDFALLRLRDPTGKSRGWFKPKAHKFEENQVQLILQHPDGRPLEVGIGRVTAVVDLPPRVTYSTNTERGSSGSPVFTMNWQLVALHHYGIKSTNNVGIPISAIWNKLAEKGLVTAIR
jgi:hypothetical protein